MSAIRAFLIALFLCLPTLSFAACPGVSTDCPNPAYNNVTVGGTLTAKNGGLIGANTTPATTWHNAIGVSDALTHFATVTLEFPTFAAFAAYKPSVVTTALAWLGAPVVAHTTGYFNAGDGGSATYNWNRTSSATADNLFIITPGGSAGGRWFLQIPSGGTDIRALGVVVDGATSADVALSAAVTACGTYGTKLFFPSGIVYLTGAATSHLQNCAIDGVNVPGAITTNVLGGSQIFVISTTVRPFTCGFGWRFAGVNIYHPNQTGAVVYPPVLSDDGTNNCSRGVIENAVFVNSYDAIAQTGATIASGGNSYTSGTGVTSLTTTFPHWLTVGQSFTLGGLTGTGGFASLNGTWTATGGTTGTTLNFTGTSGLGATTITGGGASGPGWGDIRLRNVTLFGPNDMTRLFSVGDGLSYSDVRIEPGPWLQYCAFTSPCLNAVGLASNTMRAWHFGGGAGAININAVNVVVVGARYGILVDSGALVAESIFNNITWDAVGTIIDTSSGGTWLGGNVFTGQNAACYIPATSWGQPATGNEPCFNMGPNGALNLTGFQSGGTQGDFIKTTGTSITLTDSESVNMGSNSVADHLDYYQINVAGSGTPEIRVLNSRFAGVNLSQYTHGITTTGSGTPNVVMIQGNEFFGLNDEVNMRFPSNTTVVSGNTSFNTASLAGLRSFNQINASTNAIVYYGNSWDAPPRPTLGACGTGCTIDVGSTPNSGFLTLGSGTVLSAAFTLPINMFGRCVTQSDASVAIGIVSAGAPYTVTSTFYQGASPISIPGFHLFYNCPGQ